MRRACLHLLVGAVCSLLLSATSARPFEHYPFALEVQKMPKGMQIVATNSGLMPVTTRVQISGDNISLDHNANILTTVPPMTSQVVATAMPAAPGQYNVATNSTTWMGDTRAIPNAAVAYRLPYLDGQAYVITQAANGPKTTHTDPSYWNAVDIGMPDGTPVVAARDGVVVDVISDNTEGGLDPAYMNKANSVMILHSDNTVGIYAHLAPGPSPVWVGRRVAAGEVIGTSGHTGYGTGPHLHFCVSRLVIGPNGDPSDQCVPFMFSTGQPAQHFAPQAGLLATAATTGPGQIEMVGMQEPAPAASSTEAQVHPPAASLPNVFSDINIPWWAMAGGFLLVLARIWRRATRKPLPMRRQEPRDKH